MTTQAELFKKFLKKKENKPSIPNNQRVSSLNAKRFLSNIKHKQSLQKKYGQLTQKEFEQIKKAEEIKKEEKKNLKLKQVNSAIRSSRFNSSRSGVVSHKVTRFVSTLGKRGGVTRALYKRQGLSPVDEEKIRRIKNLRMQQQQQVQNPGDRFSAWAFSDFRNPQFNVANQVEREISSVNGESSFGDRMAKVHLENDVLHFANILNGNLFNPYLQVEKEVNLFGNILP